MTPSSTKRAGNSGSKSAKSTAKPAIRTYSAAVAFLKEQTDFERMRVVKYDEESFRLDRMQSLLAGLGNPHQAVDMIHVAGTVGKGSTVAMLSSTLVGCGYTVGAYTSPHVQDLRERIAVDGSMIEKDAFASLISETAAAAKRRRIKPTFFEFLTAAAFKHFADEAVDLALVETGLGGRLDSTNVITPLMSLITRIDLDHVHILGDNVEAIAKEKAGIFKPDVPAISVEQLPAVTATLRAAAAEQGTPLRVIGKDIEFSTRFGSAEGGSQTRICLISGSSNHMHVPVPLDGEHQASNCALALAATMQLQQLGYEFDNAAVYKSLGETTLPGRMELVWKQPRIVADGAHNPASLQALIRSLGAHVPYDSMICIFGCCQDKDVDELLRRLALGADKIIFTCVDGNPRGADPVELQRRFADLSGKMTQVARSLPDALDIASRAASREDLICVTGSFYLVGALKNHFADRANA